MPMTIELFLAVLSFGVGTFGIGYMIGQSLSKKQ